MDAMFDWFAPLMVITVLAPLIVTGAIIGVVVWAIRRSMQPKDDPAVAALKERYARGEIGPAEFEVRMRSLRRDRD